MLSRIKSRWSGPPADPRSVNFTREHVSLAKAIARRRKLVRWFNRNLTLIRSLLVVAATIWLLALPYEGLWKNTYIDEHALQPAQVTTYFDWGDVHRADRCLEDLERLVNASQAERSEYVQSSFSASGLHTSNTSTSTYAHVQPPRSAGLETILVTANWVSREGGPNLRGIAMLLSLGAFLRGQNHWAFDIVLVIGEGYLDGLDGFMKEYYDLFGGVIWTALNIDYPGHSFEHIGLFYEGLNGRLPNQDVLNSVAHIARWTGGITTRLHDISPFAFPSAPPWVRHHLESYVTGAQHLLEHAKYAAAGRASGGHGVLAKHRIDAITLYCPNATGPHGFHSLGKTIESSLRTFNNLLERLHASYFFYLLPSPGKYLDVGHYLPAAILLGASVTLGGFDCPTPIEGLLWTLPALGVTILGVLLQTPLVALGSLAIPRPKGTARRSLVSLSHLFFGAIIPVLAMVNFPQAILLGILTVLYLAPLRWLKLLAIGLYPALITVDLKWEYDVLGNLAWLGMLWVWVPLTVVGSML